MNHLRLVAFEALHCCHILALCSPTSEPPEEEDDFYKTYVHTGGDLEINSTDPRTMQNNIYITCDRMRRLDILLTKMYEDPPENGGDELMRLSGIYNQACRDLFQLCKMDRWKALHAARDMMEFGGPKFLEVDLNEKKLAERFKWSKERVEMVHVERGRSHELFSDLWEIYEKLPE